jgi:hypothetical protein
MKRRETDRRAETFDATVLRIVVGEYRPRILLGFVADSDPHWRAEVSVDMSRRVDISDGDRFADNVSTPVFRNAIEHGAWHHTQNNQTCKERAWYGSGQRFKSAAYELANTFYQHWRGFGVCGVLFARWQLDLNRLQEQQAVWRKVLAAYDGSSEPNFYPYDDPTDSNERKRSDASFDAYREAGRLSQDGVFMDIESWRDGWERRKGLVGTDFTVHDQARVVLGSRMHCVSLPGVAKVEVKDAG